MPRELELPKERAWRLREEAGGVARLAGVGGAPHRASGEEEEGGGWAGDGGVSGAPRTGAAEEGEGERAQTAHRIAFSGPLVYCTRCANFAHKRVGAGIKGRCSAPTYKKANAVAARLDRLRAGRHPLSGTPL